MLRHLWSPTLRKRALDIGLFGHSEYARFIVLGRSRVGSNLLRGLLNAHPRVTAFGEIFRDASSMDWDHVGYFQSDDMRALVRADPVRFVDRRVFGRYPESVRALGFKLFYYHARSGAEAALWPYLAGRADLRVIHLKRRNLLHTHVSRKRAALTDRWVNTSGQREAPVLVRLDYEECLQDFAQTRAWEDEADRCFSDHRLLQVDYETLAAGYEDEAARIQAFLGLQPHPVEPSTFRQVREPLSATIENYQELKDRFAGTPWSGFFTE